MPYKTKDRYECAWLLLHAKQDYLGEEVEEDLETGKKQVYLLFENKEKQEELVEMYQTSREKDFANNLDVYNRIVRKYTRNYK